jgi:hypothetical protein
MYNFYNFLNVTTYFYIYPRIMAAKNVDCEFHKKITSIQMMILNHVKCNNYLICIDMKISQKCLDQFLYYLFWTSSGGYKS